MTDTDPRRPITWIVEFNDNSRWDELEEWAEEHKCDVDRMAPRSAGDVFSDDWHVVYRASLTCWDARVATLGKLMWGGSN